MHLALLLLVCAADAALLFQQTNLFGALQIKLSTSSGFITQSKDNTFSFANPGYYNFSSLGLALCGYDIAPGTSLQFNAQASFDDQANTFSILVLPLNSTSFYFVNYYLLLTSNDASAYLAIQTTCISLTPSFDPSQYNRVYQYTVTSVMVVNMTSTATALPFISSVNCLANPVNYQNITSAYFSNTNTITVKIFLNYSAVSQVCLSLVLYYNSLATNTNQFINISYGIGLALNSAVPALTLASASQTNFSINAIYGPMFAPKCVVGFAAFSLGVSSRQTLSFNLTGTGVFNLLSSSNYLINYHWFCVAAIKCPSPSYQYYPAINDCQPACAVLNCSVCSTSTSCLTCQSGFFLNALYRCTVCLANCLSCSNSSYCQTCISGNYFNPTTGQCTTCQPYCLLCTANACNSCATGYFISSISCISCSAMMPNCLQCTNPISCSVCPNATYFQSYSAGCVSCNTVSLGCTACNAYYCNSCTDGYYLNSQRCFPCTVSQTGCCSFFIPNCTTCTTATTCTQCMAGYYLVPNTSPNLTCLNCSTAIPHCLNCNNNNTCLLCANGYSLNNSLCLPCNATLPNCALCLNLTACLTCTPPYLAVNGTCYNCPIWPLQQLYYLDGILTCHSCTTVTNHCIRCTSGLKCSLCSDLYYLSSNLCLLCSSSIPYCLACKNASNCSLCANGYFLNTTTGSCAPCANELSDCLSCASVYLGSVNDYVLGCVLCQPQFFINGSICSRCSQTLSFCLTCISSYECSLCESEYYLSSSLSCISCSQLMVGCTACNSSSLCLSCGVGYYLASSYCTQCAMAINNCYACAVLNGNLTCQTCTNGYYMASNFICRPCAQVLQYCTACSSQAVCTACITGYFPNSNNFTCSPCANVLPNCDYCTPALTCEKCLTNYQFDSYGDCLSCAFFIPGCQTCNYTLNPKTNTSQLNCSACLTGYLIYTLSSNFTQCISCSSAVTYCSVCSSLTQCQQCSNTSFLSATSQCLLCSLYLPNCLLCTSSSACSSCAPNYYLRPDGSCQSCDPAQFGTAPNYYFMNICTTCVYSGTTAQCTLCLNGYYPYMNSCAACNIYMKNCTACTSSSNCQACNNGYYLSTNQNSCVPCSSTLLYCASCTAAGVCISCNADCYLNSAANQCIKCSSLQPGCASCYSNFTCYGCIDGFYLNGQSCLNCSSSMNDCAYCYNATYCAVKVGASQTANPISSLNWYIYLIIILLCLLLLLLLAYCLYRCYRKNNPIEEKPTEHTAFDTQRELVHSDPETQSNKVDLRQNQICHFCKTNPVGWINVELLCGECAKIEDRGNRHKIKQKTKKRKGSQANQMKQSLQSQHLKQLPPFKMQPKNNSKLKPKQPSGINLEPAQLMLQSKMGNHNPSSVRNQAFQQSNINKRPSNLYSQQASSAAPINNQIRSIP